MSLLSCQLFAKKPYFVSTIVNDILVKIILTNNDDHIIRSCHIKIHSELLSSQPSRVFSVYSITGGCMTDYASFLFLCVADAQPAVCSTTMY